MRWLRRIFLVVVGGLVAAACSGGGESTTPTSTTTVSTITGDGPSTSSSAPPSGPTTIPPSGPMGVDWSSTTQVITLENGWTIQHCEGDAPIWCVDDGERTVKAFALYRFPIEVNETLLANPTVGGLAQWTGEVFSDLLQDRRVGCGEDYDFRQVPPEFTNFTGQEGVRYGFVGVTADGASAEATVAYATIHGRSLTIMLSEAYNEGGCVATEGPEMTVAQLNELAEFLDEVAAQSATPLPSQVGA